MFHDLGDGGKRFSWWWLHKEDGCGGVGVTVRRMYVKWWRKEGCAMQ